MSTFITALTTASLFAFAVAFSTNEANANVVTGLGRPIAATTNPFVLQTGFVHGGHHGGHSGFGHPGGHAGFGHHQHFFSHHHHAFIPYLYYQPYCYSCYRRHHHHHGY